MEKNYLVNKHSWENIKVLKILKSSFWGSDVTHFKSHQIGGAGEVRGQPEEKKKWTDFLKHKTLLQFTWHVVKPKYMG